MDQVIYSVAPLIALGAASYIGQAVYNKALDYWIQAKPNEWLLVIRNGELRGCDVGLGAWVFPGDAAVKFPSKLHKVNFTAEQVTNEMQGVEVKGILIWSIYRQKDGPFRAYKSFGEDLKRPIPHEANSQLQNMAVSIVRDRIANLTMDDVLKNRSKIRNGVKEEMEKILTGWGVWLETCEILDVYVASKSLFKNLQTEFREKARQEAEKISATTDNQIRQETLVRNNAFNKLKNESDTEYQIFQNNQTLKVQEKNGEIYEETLKIDKQKAEAENIKLLRQEEMKVELQQKRLELQGKNQLYQIELSTTKEAEHQKYLAVTYETQQQALDNELLKDEKKEKAQLESMEDTLAVKTKGYTENVLKSMVLDTTKDIYSHLRIDSMNVCNVGGGSGSGQQDPAGQLIAQVAASYKAISESM